MADHAIVNSENKQYILESFLQPNLVWNWHEHKEPSNLKNVEMKLCFGQQTLFCLRSMPQNQNHSRRDIIYIDGIFHEVQAPAFPK